MKPVIIWFIFMCAVAVVIYFGQVADKQAKRERDELRKWGGR